MMDVKKHVLPEQGKAYSRLWWALVVSLIVITGLLLNNSLQGPVMGSLLQASSYSYSVTSNATTLSLNSSSSVDSVPFGYATEELQKHVDTEKNEIEINGNASKVAEMQDDFLETEGDFEADLEDGVDVQIEGTNKDANLGVVEQDPNAGSLGMIMGNSSAEILNDGTFIGENVVNNADKVAVEGVVDDASNVTTENDNNVDNLSNNRETVGISAGGEEKAMELNDKQGNLFEENKTINSFETCDLFDGRWVWDNHSKPYYSPGSCPYLDKGFECQKNGRPDRSYMNWKWQPNGCDLPRLNATDFLERLRGKRLVFIGDSLNRNMWESMVCILRRSIKKKNRVYEISGRHDFKKKGIYAFRFEDYNCSVDFVAAPFLVKESSFKRENGSIETLRLDLMDPSTSMYHDADFMVFNTGHWWTHEKTSKGEDYYQEGDYVYPRLKVLNAFQKALKTWSRWLDENIDSSRTQVFFRGYSVSHFWGGQWNSGGRCHQETEPISNETYLTKYPSKMRALEDVLQNTKTPVMYLNITRLTDYRKDAHPSIYRKEYKTEEEKNAAIRGQDCSHWCLPGVPDTWNELLYASLLKAGKGIFWRN